MKTTRDLFFDRFLDALQLKCGLSAGKVVVAFSGGSDSMALLHLLKRAAKRLPIELVALHVNHNLRQAAGDDQAYCENLCREWGVPFEYAELDTRTEARERGLSLETAAREGRYRLLEECAHRHGAMAIALGHTMNDQAETVLANMVRGTGVRGLAAMPWRHGLRVRPLLEFGREGLQDYLRSQGVTWLEDATNESPEFTRNRIRHQVLPLLQREFNPQIISALSRLAHNAAEAESWMQQETKQAFAQCLGSESEKKIVLDIHRFSSYFSSIQKQLVREALERISRGTYRADFTDLQRAEKLLLRGRTGKRVTFGSRWELLIDHGCIVIRAVGSVRGFSRRCERGGAVSLPDIGEITITGPMPRTPDQQLPQSRFEQLIDADQVKGDIIVRSVRHGDRFHPLGSGGNKTLSNFFTDRKIPLHMRGEIPLITCDAGIIWVVGLQIDDRFKVTTQTTSLLHLAFKEYTQ